MEWFLAWNGLRVEGRDVGLAESLDVLGGAPAQCTVGITGEGATEMEGGLGPTLQGVVEGGGEP